MRKNRQQLDKTSENRPAHWSRQPHSVSPETIAVSLGWLGWGALHWHAEQLPIGKELLPTVGMGVAIFFLMLGCIMAVVHYADELADMLREPYGTLVLTLSSTIIEVSLMLRVMLHGSENPTLLRDTVFAVLMIAMNGMVGSALTAGGWRHMEQVFNFRGAIAFVQLIAPLSLLMLVIPNFTETSDGPTLAPVQEAYLGGLCIGVYLLFLLIQTGRHRSYFDHLDSAGETRTDHAHVPMAWNWPLLFRAVGGLVFSLIPMVLLSEHLGEAISFGIDEYNFPTALGGVIIATLGLIPEGIGAIRATWVNQIQRSINIVLGTALSTIGLTVPCMMILAACLGKNLTLGLEPVNRTLLQATLLVTMLTSISGTSTILQGIIHLMLFVGYLIFIVFP